MRKVTKVTFLHLILIVLLLGVMIISLPQAAAFFKNRNLQNASLNQNYVAAPLSESAKVLREKLTGGSKATHDVVLDDNKDFSVVYVISNNSFKVIVKASPFSQGKQSAEKWFMGKGFEGYDLCLLNVNFLSADGKILTLQEQTFEKCPVPDVASPLPSTSALK